MKKFVKISQLCKVWMLTTLISREKVGFKKVYSQRVYPDTTPNLFDRRRHREQEQPVDLRSSQLTDHGRFEQPPDGEGSLVRKGADFQGLSSSAARQSLLL